MNTRATLGIAIAAALIVGVTAWRHQGKRVSPEVDDVSGAGTASTIAGGSSQSQDPSPSRASAAARGGLDGPAGEHLRSANAVATAGQRKLQARYESETTNAAWADAKQQTLRRLAADPMIVDIKAVPQDLAIDCRSSSCRLEASFANATQANDFFTLYTMVAAPEISNASMTSKMQSDGRLRVEIHGLARR